MIDFRYHLVSLISVFLALAVGIVLGAGPLRESIGDTLTEQVQQLRQEKDTLRADLATADAGTEHRDDFVDAVSGTLVGGSLTDRRVVLVRLPGVEDAAVEPVTDTLGVAGASVVGTIEIGDAWTAADKGTLREELAAQIGAEVPGGLSGTGTPAQLADLLARGLVSTGPVTGTAAAPAAETATVVLSALEGGDLISGDVDGLADAAILLAPGLERATNGQTQPTAAPENLSAFVDVARALGGRGKGAVVSGPASSATNGGVVQAVRQDDVANREVSSVDSGGTPMGVVASVLALREQIAGAAGRYGFGDGATAPLPTTAAAG